MIQGSLRLRQDHTGDDVADDSKSSGLTDNNVANNAEVETGIQRSYIGIAVSLVEHGFSSNRLKQLDKSVRH